MEREDAATLLALGLDDAACQEMGLAEPAAGDPSSLMDLYLRRSAKREDLATLRGHLRDAVRYAQANSLSIRHVWFEQLSASKAYVRRPEFEKAVAAVLSGASKTLAVWKTDRLDRRGMGAVGRVLDDLDQRRARLVSLSEGLDSSKGGRIVFAILSERARDEARDIGMRVKIGHDSHKSEGRRGTGPTPYGVISEPGSGKVAPHPEEYELARHIADRLLAGETARGIAMDLNAAGHRTRRGAAWDGGKISTLAHSPLWAGMVPERERLRDEHDNPLGRWVGRALVARDETGAVRRCGTGVVSVGEWHRIQALLAERTTSGQTGVRRGKAAPRFLGTNIIRCGRNGCTVSHRSGGYRCVTHVVQGSAICPGVYASAKLVDFAVGEAWQRHVATLGPEDDALHAIARRWAALSDPGSQAEYSAASEALEAAQKRVQRLEDDYYLYGKLSEDRYEALAAAQRGIIDSMTVALGAMGAATDLSIFGDGETLREMWNGAELAERRMLLQATLTDKGIVLMPAAHKGAREPIEGRLRFNWTAASGE